jgi:predicted ATPase
MITEASLTHFKSWRRIGDMRFAPITGLFGTNSSGKTSILQWLLMLKQTAESSDRHQVLNFGDDRDPVQLGTFRDVVFRHSETGRISWKLSWSLPAHLKVADPQGGRGTVLFLDDQMSFSCEVREEAGRLKVAAMEYDFDNSRFVYKAKEGKSGYQLVAESEESFRFKRSRGRQWDLPAPVKCYGFPDQVSSYFQNAGFLADFQLAFEEQMARTYYLGPLREYPQRQYTWAGSQPADMGRRGEKVIDAILAARDRGEKISRGKGKPKLSVEEYAAYWLKKLNLIDSFLVQPVAPGSNLYQVHVRKVTDAADVLITDVGFGISQILPVIVLCYYVPEGSTIILEQPEIHLHPSVQAGLADVFIDAIKVRKIQILLESHSEHLLRRLQRRIAEQAEEFASDDIALYFCDYQDEQSRLIALDVDELGNVRNWPKDFFGDELGEMAAMTRAQMERMRAPA